MNKLITALCSLLIASALNAQVSKTINISAGSLSSVLISEEKNNITNLTITGTIDARDFLTMRDSMPQLAVIDLEESQVVAYSGNHGTTWDSDYLANQIPTEAFYKYNIQNTRLVSIKIPNTVTRIDDMAFYKCDQLSYIQLPNSLTTIGMGVFWDCNSLTTIELPNSLEEIEDWAFLDSNLKTLKIPASVKKMGKRAFANCYGLESVDIQATVTILEESIFYFCMRLKTVVIPQSVNTIGKYAFQSCTNMTSVYIPSSVTKIERNAFDFCLKLSSVAIPSSVTSLGSYAFYSCESIRTVISENPVPIDLSSSTSVFAGVNSLKPCTLVVANSSVDAYKSADQWKSFKFAEDIQNIDLAYTFDHLASEESTNTIDLTTPNSWEITTDQPWITITPTSGTGNSQISVVASANTTSSDRTGNIVFWSKNCMPKLVSFTQSAEQKVLSVSESQINIGALTGSTDSVAISSNLEWSANSDQTWLTVGPANGTGNGTLVFAAEANPTTAVRTATVSLAAAGVSTQIITVTQAAGPATLSVSKNTASVACEANSTANISVTSNIAWTASSNQTWLTVSPASGTGNKTLIFTAEANPAITSRSAKVSIAATDVTPQTITITQTAGNAVLSVSQDTASVACEANSTTNISITSNIAWTASSNQTWLTVSPANGTGKGTLIFTAEANPAITSRSAKVSIAATDVTPQTITITQAAGKAVLTVSQDTASIGYEANSTASISITSNTDWTATSDQTWLTVSPANGTGKGTLTFKAEANPAAIIRTATCTISSAGIPSQKIVVTQAASRVSKTTLELSRVSIYPNPANKVITIKGVKGTETFILSNFSGEIILNVPVADNESLDIARLPKGIYLARIASREKTTAIKLIKN